MNEAKRQLTAVSASTPVSVDSAPDSIVHTKYSIYNYTKVSFRKTGVLLRHELDPKSSNVNKTKFLRPRPK